MQFTLKHILNTRHKACCPTCTKMKYFKSGISGPYLIMQIRKVTRTLILENADVYASHGKVTPPPHDEFLR